MDGKTFKDVVAEHGRTFRNASEAYRQLTGKTLSDGEAAEQLWYQGLRNRMVEARKLSGASQATVAQAMSTSQSEISRLENSLGPGTRLGSLRGYLAAFGQTLEDLLAARPEPGASAQETLPEPAANMRMVIEGEEFVGMEAVGIRDSLQAMNNLLNRSGIGAEQRKDVILGFLHELSRVRGVARPIRPTGFNVKIEVAEISHEPLIGTVPRRKAEAVLSDVRFRTELAEPLNLDL